MKITTEDIMDIVLKHLSVSRTELVSKSRERRIVLARELIVHLSRCFTKKSHQEIAMDMGLRTGSTAYTAHKRLLKRIGEDGFEDACESNLYTRNLTQCLWYEVRALEREMEAKG